MVLSRLSDRITGWLGTRRGADHSTLHRRRGPRTHVIILDGTMSSLCPGEETNAGHTFRLLQEMPGAVNVYYEAGPQWCSWSTTPDVAMGRGINRQIQRAYGYLASRYRDGDKIFLFGFSRGAFAVRSLAGIVDMVGLLRRECATERNIRTAYRHYRNDPRADAARAFVRAHCLDGVEIEMLGVWDTVKALGLRLPVVWQWSDPHHAFHNHELGASIRHGFHAIALHETREVFEPVLWSCPPGWQGTVEQVWFPGTHGDVGGQLGGYNKARPLANVPLVWMLERAETCGLPLPPKWRMRFPTDPCAPSVGTWRGWGKMFLLRKRRVVGVDRSERLHDSVYIRQGGADALDLPGAPS